MTNRLVTIPFSHYCEKARWALDRAGIEYAEDGHLPLLHRRATRKAGAKRTVPALVTTDGAVVVDSTDILRWCDQHGHAPALFPAELPEVAQLEEEFDRRLGPAARRVGYGELLPSKPAFVELISKGVPAWQSRAARLARPLVTRIIARGLNITPDGVARSRVVVDEVFARVGARVADGRPYLCGDRFTAADLTFASLAAPVLMPAAYARHFGANLPASFLALRDSLRATPAGAFAMRLYARDRAARPTR